MFLHEEKTSPSPPQLEHVLVSDKILLPIGWPVPKHLWQNCLSPDREPFLQTETDKFQNNVIMKKVRLNKITMRHYQNRARRILDYLKKIQGENVGKG